jgi:hypothetical protein
LQPWFMRCRPGVDPSGTVRVMGVNYSRGLDVFRHYLPAPTS